MAGIDVAIIVAYFVGMIAVGLYFSRRAAKGMQAYFLGDNKHPWWMLAVAGSASNYDVTGTMFLVSLFYVAGLRSFWMLWSWQFMGTAFLMAYMAIWIRRTRVMTAVELLRIRFGEDSGGRMARAAGAILMVTFLIFSVGYDFVGISKFLPHIIPDSLPGGGRIWAIVLMALTTLYVVGGGFSGIVVTDLIQSILMSFAGILLGVVVFLKLDPDMIKILHEKFNISMLPQAHLSMPAGYEDWNNFGILCVFWFFAGFLLNTSGAGGHYQEQRFLATRSEADAARAGCAWGFFLIPRWTLIAGFCFIVASGMIGSDDPEQILPVVLADMIPSGARGLILAALMAAFMSTFSAVINAAASIVVRDLIHPFRPNLSDKAQVRLSYLVTITVVLLGVAAGYKAETIRSIWTWMIIGLIGGSLIPNVLRWHWWRLNGWGYSTGIFMGLITALGVKFNLFGKNPSEYFYAPIVWAMTFIGCIVGSLLTDPTKTETLEHFYKCVRPFGFWGPIKTRVSVDGLGPGVDRPLARVIVNVILGVVCLTGSFVSAFFVIGHYRKESIIAVSLVAISGTILYFNWYRPLIRSEKE